MIPTNRGVGFITGADYLQSMIDDIYNKDVLRLAAEIGRTEPVANAQATVELSSPLCGSSITVDLSMKDGRVTEYGQTIHACALGQAAASVMAAQVMGRKRAEIEAVLEAMSGMLTAGGPAPEGDWAALGALAPASEATSRHGAILLPFKAVLEAMDQIEAKTTA